MDAEIPENQLIDAMRRALAEGRKWLGATSPNPPVGAVALGRDGQVLATTAHCRTGEAHAEAALIEQCRADNLLGEIAALCVTLEPCNHQGRTPPCTETIIEAGIPLVAIGTRDPNPNVAGGGIERLTSAGVNVVTGIEEEACRRLIASFAYSVKTGKPFITIKRAFDRNGSQIPPPGQKTFTSPDSLKLAHRLRKKADAIIAGSGTILVDDPLFTVRYVPDHPGKRRILAIIDRRRRVTERYLSDAAERGLDAAVFDTLEAAFNDLKEKGIRDVLIEAGPLLSEAIFNSHLWSMSVTIQQGDPDSVEVRFNPRETMPFSTDNFNWDEFLPG